VVIKMVDVRVVFILMSCIVCFVGVTVLFFCEMSEEKRSEATLAQIRKRATTRADGLHFPIYYSERFAIGVERRRASYCTFGVRSVEHVLLICVQNHLL
jgi:hypothetical protein